MARSKAVAKSAGGKGIATIDQELANEVAALKGQIGQPAGNKITANADGTFALPDGLNLGTEFQCVVVDFVSKNQFYDAPYQPGVITPPTCYAIGRNLAEMAPEPDSPVPQADKCSTCPMNQYGSAQNGRGKACSNRRLAAVLVLDPDNPEGIDNPAEPLYILDLPPTAIKSFDGMVSYIARSLNKPPVGAIVTVTGTPSGTYSAISFTDPVPNPSYAAHYARRDECQDLLFRKPDFSTLANAAPARGNARRKSAAPARRAPSARR